MKKLLLLLVVVLLLAGTVLTVSANPRTGGDAGRPLVAVLSGANEVANGDLDGSGLAEITFNQGLGQVCWNIRVSDIGENITGAHIHAGAAGVNGGILVHVGVGKGCTTASRDVIQAIRRNPSGFYVNVHTLEHPSGAIRGQLG